MKINQVLEKSQEKIKGKVLNYQKEALLITSFVLNIGPETIIAQPNKEINRQQFKKITGLSKKRSQNWPLAYLTGIKSFYNLEFIVNKNTLIPRPESELIVDKIIKAGFRNKKTIIVDIGTGSGCLIISLADMFKKNDHISFYAIDISRKSLKVAKKNAKKHSLKKEIKFIKGNLLKPFIKKIKAEKEGVDIIIIANLPYLTKKEIKKEPSISKEPRRALYGGKDGLKYYKEMWSQIQKINTAAATNFTVYQEINDEQREKLEKIITSKMKHCTIQNKTIKDLNNQQRLLVTNFIL